MTSARERRVMLEAQGDGFASAFAPHRDVPQSTDEILALMRTPIRVWSLHDKMRTISRLFRWEGRYRTIRHFLIIVATLNALALAFDMLEHQASAVLLARLAISASCLAGAAALLRLRSLPVESLCANAPLFVCLALACFAPLAASPGVFQAYVDQAVFVVTTGLCLLVVDFLHLTILAALSSIVLIVAIALSPLQMLAKLQMAAFYLTAFVAVLNVRRIAMAYRHRNILHYFKCELQRRKLAELTEQLNRSATTDQLTGLGNRHLFTSIVNQMPRTMRVALLMIDIDRFKVLNDTLGHSAGDMCLVAVAQAIERRIEGAAHAMRYGGEEFVVCASDIDAAGALELAERIRADVANAPICTSLTITVSVGVALGPIEAVDRLLKESDDALYRAKAQGRNRVCMADGVSEARSRLSPRV